MLTMLNVLPKYSIQSPILHALDFLVEGGAGGGATLGDLGCHLVLHEDGLHGDLLGGSVVPQQPR